LSDLQPNRQLVDWPNDVIELANTLYIEKISIFGLSGRGPHVLASAYKIPARIKMVAIVSGTGPPEMPDRCFTPTDVRSSCTHGIHRRILPQDSVPPAL